MTAKLVSKKRRAKAIYSFNFLPEKALSYLAGQYIEMTVNHPSFDSRGQKRWFTLSSSPNDKYITITTRISPKSKSSSFKQALNNLSPGDQIQISQPMGDFVLPIDKTTPLLFVAGGIGITPFLSILSYLHTNKQTRTISLLYAATEPSQVINLDKYQDLLAEYSVLLTRLTPDIILTNARKLGQPLIYLAGPEAMVESLNQQLIDSGIEPSRLVGDYFPGYDN